MRSLIIFIYIVVLFIFGCRDDKSATVNVIAYVPNVDVLKSVGHVEMESDELRIVNPQYARLSKEVQALRLLLEDETAKKKLAEIERKLETCPKELIAVRCTVAIRELEKLQKIVNDVGGAVVFGEVPLHEIPQDVKFCESLGFAPVFPAKHPTDVGFNWDIKPDIMNGFYREGVFFSNSKTELAIQYKVVTKTEWAQIISRQIFSGDLSPVKLTSSWLISKTFYPVRVIGERSHQATIEKLFDFDSTKNPEWIQQYTERGGGSHLTLIGPGDADKREIFRLGQGYRVDLTGRLNPVVTEKQIGDDSGIPENISIHYMDVFADNILSMTLIDWVSIPGKNLPDDHYPNARGTVYRVTLHADPKDILLRYPLQYSSPEQIKQLFDNNEITAAWKGTVSYIGDEFIQFKDTEIILPRMFNWPREKGGLYTDRTQAELKTNLDLREGDQIIAMGKISRDLNQRTIIAIAPISSYEEIKKMARTAEDPNQFYEKILNDNSIANIKKAYKAKTSRIYHFVDRDERRAALWSTIEGPFDPDRINIWVDKDGLVIYIWQG